MLEAEHFQSTAGDKKWVRNEFVKAGIKFVYVVLSDKFLLRVWVKRQSNNQRTSLWTIITGEHVNANLFNNRVICFL